MVAEYVQRFLMASGLHLTQAMSQWVWLRTTQTIEQAALNMLVAVWTFVGILSNVSPLLVHAHPVNRYPIYMGCVGTATYNVKGNAL